MKNIFISLTVLVAALAFAGCGTNKSGTDAKEASVNFEQIDGLIEKGMFADAQKLINSNCTKGGLSAEDVYSLNFEQEKMKRISAEFSKTDSDVIPYIKKYIPDVTYAQIDAWRKSGALEAMQINGSWKYFNKGARNLFRIDTMALKAFEKVEGKESGAGKFLSAYLPDVVAKAKAAWKPGYENNETAAQKASYVKPEKMILHFTLEVNPDAVPAGEVVRVWMPYPRQTAKYADVKLLSISQPDYIQSPVGNKRSSIYMEKISNGKDTLKFGYDLSLTSYNQYFAFDPKMIKPYNKNSEIYKEYTAETKKHVIFTDRIKHLTDSIVGKVTNPYEKVSKIWCWINDHFVWAGARDYSTIDNIPMYVLKNKHGDCGQVSLLFITMARYAGVPAKWQSGWMLHPGDTGVHDWAEAYYEGIGWVPVDQSFGYTAGNDNDLRMFYSRGLDAYRYIVNDNFCCPLYPAKVYPHSDMVDFQMGEVEWRCGNLYYDKWGADLNVEYIK